MKNILVAEDNLNLGLIWENWLGELGHAVTRTTNKASALAAFQPNFYALAVLDIRMPSVQGGRSINITAGLEAALEMRQRDPFIPVLFLTASDDEDIEADALTLPGRGKREFVRKPCGREAFQIRVQEMVGKNRFRFGPHAMIDISMHTATIDGRKTPRHLQPQVCNLAVVFERNENITLSRAELIRQWGGSEGSLDETVRVLRRAVNDGRLTVIQNIHGTGYVYNPQGG